MTLEELQAELETAKESIEAMGTKNKQLLGELKTERNKSKEVDVDAYHKAIDELDALKTENAKLQGDAKLKAKDFDKLNLALGEKDGALSNLLIENGLVSALTEAGVKPELMKYVKDSLKSQAKLVNENGEFKAMIGDKNLSDFMTDWKQGDGQHVITAPQNSGSGATGGQGQGGGSTTQKRSEMSHGDKAKYITEHGQDAYLKLP